ncbi:hypothetical protein PUN28_005443 [Cardiocondyla obscurior]|uniref:Uncharacterized protein n=1 Tax=Cardiocondyla obscurior TaxID=286306 RepID=A0AAW2GG03_9HYME
MIRWIGFSFGIAGLVFAMELFGPNIEALRGSGAYIYFPIMRRWWRKEKEKKCCTGLHASSLTCHRLRWISLALHGSPPA